MGGCRLPFFIFSGLLILYMVNSSVISQIVTNKVAPTKLEPQFLDVNLIANTYNVLCKACIVVEKFVNASATFDLFYEEIHKFCSELNPTKIDECYLTYLTAVSFKYYKENGNYTSEMCFAVCKYSELNQRI